MEIVGVRPRLYRIFLEQEIQGFQRFIGSWFVDGEQKFLVDVGPTSSIDPLIEGLKALKAERLDYVFLTHIHIDHAGGTGILLKHFPRAKVICHGSGIKHLMDPRKLWEGSQKILGDLALKYGEILPVPGEALVASKDFNENGYKLMDTPGHAPHHISLIYKDYLFAGEAGGIFLDVNGQNYLRPATPPKFVLEEAVESVDRMIGDEAQEICYAHTWIHGQGKSMLKKYKDQLYLWKEVVAEQMKEDRGGNLVDQCVAALLKKDELLWGFNDLTQDDKAREFYYIRNSIQGYVEYLKRA